MQFDYSDSYLYCKREITRLKQAKQDLEVGANDLVERIQHLKNERDGSPVNNLATKVDYFLKKRGLQGQLARIRPQIDRINKKLEEVECMYAMAKSFLRLDLEVVFSSLPPLNKVTDKDIAKVEERILKAPLDYEEHWDYTALELKMLINIKHELLESVRENGNTIPENIKGEIEDLFRNSELRGEFISDMEAYFVKAFTSAKDNHHEVNLKAYDLILRKYVAKAQSQAGQ